jgi:hypothetical protein
MKEIWVHTMTRMSCEDIMLDERSHHERTDAVWFHVCEVPRTVKSHEQKVQLSAAGGTGKESYLVGLELQFGVIKGSTEDGGDGRA